MWMPTMDDGFKKPKAKKNYIDAKEMQEEYDLSLQLGKPTDKLIGMFKKIATHFYGGFQSLNRLDDAAIISFAVSEAWKKWRKYDSQRSLNIFSFFTTVIANDLRTHYNKLTKNNHRHISIESLFLNNKDA